MIDEDDAGPVSGPDNGILYDYFKYLTSLCVFSLGGVLALADRVPDAGRGRELLVGALAILSFAALFAFTGIGEIVRARTRSEPLRPQTLRYANIAPMMLAIGLGMFTYLFVRSLF